jgi:tRNA threonylcarbamoyladenosine biosynthesis protein TsaB
MENFASGRIKYYNESMKKIKINTSDNKQITIQLEINDEKVEEIFSDSKLLRSQAVLPLIEDILKKNDLTLKDLDGIDVFEGPGSFTGLRVGISIANALGFLLNVPVNGKKVGELARPVYN